VDSAPYNMSLSLNVLNHLGLNLYSNSAAVLAEVVANSWDADAETVTITVDPTRLRIEVTDDGRGMTKAEINARYLTVGYQRRVSEDPLTAVHHRPVMGRKGIGKLSLFSIAGTIEVHTARDGEKSGFIMRLSRIQESIKSGEGTYNPEPIDPTTIEVSKGTKIVLTEPRRSFSRVAKALRRRLARRFSVIGDEYKFAIVLDGTPISVSDRDYFKKLQYVWHYGTIGAEAASLATKAEQRSARSGAVVVKENGDAELVHNVTGWIGSVGEVSALREDEENLNTIVVMVRGKLAQEDILEECATTGMVTKYLIGEIHADFLDVDDRDDIATSSRQRIIEDDQRYVALREFMKKEIAAIRYEWTKQRGKAGTERALALPAIKKWFDELPKDAQHKAESLFSKINQITMESEDERKRLLKHSVLAFESFRYKENLDALEKLSAEDLASLSKVFAEFDDIEATLYHQIVTERVEVIRALREKVEKNALEKVIQKYLFDHLWLLDPSWERATGTEFMEQNVDKEFKKVDAGLTAAEKNGRLDIKYATTSGKHVIVELKRAEVVISTSDVLGQLSKYRSALRKLLEKQNRGHEPIDCVCVVGQRLQDWVDEPDGRAESAKSLDGKNIRVVMYDELIEQAYRAYHRFLQQSTKRGRVLELIQSIEEADFSAL
jgi:Histidine kinase-, DNA gyrase B-, and HSP90-like ATPase